MAPIIFFDDPMKLFLMTLITMMTLENPACAAPDEDILGKALGYPLGTAENYFTDDSLFVGSF